MRWNEKKFQLLWFGPNRDLKEETYIFTPNFNDIIEAKNYVKDLGILVDNMYSYKNQQMAAVKKVQQKSAWIFRTFGTKNIDFLRKIEKSLVQSHLDYGSKLWATVSTKFSLIYMEGPL